MKCNIIFDGHATNRNRQSTMVVVTSVMIQKILLDILFISTALSDVVHLQNLKTNDKFNLKNSNIIDATSSASENGYNCVCNPSTYSCGTSTPNPFEFDNSFSTTISPLQSNSYSSNQNIESLEYVKSFPSETFTNSATVESFDGSLLSSQGSVIGSTTPIYDKSFTSSIPNTFITYSTTPSSIQYSNTFSGTKYLPPPASDSKSSQNFDVSYDASFPSTNPLFTQETKPAHNSHTIAIENIPEPQKNIIITKEVAVPYFIQIEKIVPYPVEIRIPDPYPVTVEKHTPYQVKINVDNPVHVPQLYPVEVEKRVPYPFAKSVPYEVKVPVVRPYPVPIPFEKPVPYAVEQPVPYPVRVNVDRPYPVENPVPYPVPVEKKVPYPVEKTVPYPVEKLVPYPVEKKVPYPVKYVVPVNVPVPVKVKVPVAVYRPVPYPAEKDVPYPVQVPVEVTVPVQSSAQTFATIQYHQQSPISFGYESTNFNQSDYNKYTPISTQLISTNTKPFDFYNTSPTSDNRYDSNTTPISSYIPTQNSATIFGSNQAQDGFTNFSDLEKNIGSSSFLNSSNSADASSLFKPANIGSSYYN